ncbi:hypothetical protein D5S19_31455 [Amycolatopsis panacis]|uniref:DNA methylase N-4/N-6 domain-containing protein n=1 Tax=Amycolatopsis panacis TaxID=2340917 RepID=A0A419HJS7_9PSEU|nr:hypothetical protein D5S19_31455 [Amycolatopsis panacis]
MRARQPRGSPARRTPSAGPCGRCIAAGCPDGGVVLDPFSGAATTGLAARQLGRCYLGIDLNREFHDIGLRRLGLSAQDIGRAA